MIKFYNTRGEHGHMSNFFPCTIFCGTWKWSSSERLYQASKTDSILWKERIRLSKNNFEACAIGRSGELPIIENWDKIKVNVMYDILLMKYTQNRGLLAKLLSTGDEEIVEDSPTDYFWGCGRDGTGANMLGNLLMKVRKELST